MTARQAALKALMTWRRGGVLPDSFTGMDRRDGALAERITLGVLQNMALLDYSIDRFSSVKCKKMQPKLLDILRISAYQLLFLERVPPSAVVFEAVELCKGAGAVKAGGLVNAVLRRIAENREAAFDLAIPDELDRLSLRYSHPKWLVSALAARLGMEGAAAYLEKDNSIAPVYLQINTLKAGSPRHGETHPWLPDCLVALSGGPKGLEGFDEGVFYVQDPASRCAVIAASPAPGSTVLDACAAPGGKTAAAAIMMQNRGRILSCDVSAKKLEKIEEATARLGISCAEIRQMDARAPDIAYRSAFDTVFADVPCSGLGVIRKKPEIRYKNPDSLAALPETQLEILMGLSPLVKPGGVLLYSTCTVLKRENEDVIGAFLKKSPEYMPEAFSLPCPGGEAAGGMITLWPHIHGCDGFFIAKMRKRP